MRSTGLTLAFLALTFWSISPFFFTQTSRRMGPFATNLLRLAIAFGLLLLASAALGPLGLLAGKPAPPAWLWLTGSGVVGLAVGDAFLYRSFVTLGPERTSQIQVLAPAATAALACLWLGEFLSKGQTAGMALTLAGVYMATSSAARERKRAATAATAKMSAATRIAKIALTEHATAQESAATLVAETPSDAGSADPRTSAAEPRRGKHAGYLDGAWAAVWSALFQGLGTVLARKAFRAQADLDPVLATTIRIGAGTAALWGYARARGPLEPVLRGWREPSVTRMLLVGTLMGPLLGMLCYVGALKHAPAGIVTTITFMTPLLIIPAGAKLYGTRISPAALWGTTISLGGVILLGLA